MIYLCSDLHFCHNKEFLYGPRGFSSIQEHDEAIVRRWNSIITDDDIVYVLGDIMMGAGEYGITYLRQLKGQIKIIPGNHDGDRKLTEYTKLDNVEILPLSYLLKYRKKLFYLSHYPTLTSNYDDDKNVWQRVINICGHAHTKDPFADFDKGFIYHVEMDAHNCYPVALDDIITDIRKKYDEKRNEGCLTQSAT